MESPEGIHQTLEKIQEKIVFLPDYSFKSDGQDTIENEESWPAVSSGTTVSGLVGGAMILVLAVTIGLVIHNVKKRKKITV